MEKKENKIKKSFAGKKFRSGAYSTVLTIIVIAVLIFVNLFVGELNINPDVSSDKMYTLTKDTKDLVLGLSDDITIYYMVQEGNEYEVLEKVLDQYDTLKSNVKVEHKDPLLYPTFSQEYTDEKINENDVIVVNNTTKSSRYIPYADIYVQDVDYSTQQTTTTLDAEGQITSALQYITTKEFPKLYVTSGHGEVQFGKTISDMIKKSNVTTEVLTTGTSQSIPEDCKVLLVNGPTKDFTEDEITMIKAYLDAGGKAILFTSNTEESMTNYYTLLNYYGVSIVDGVVLEAQGHYLSTYPNYVVPTISKTSEITASMTSDAMVTTPVCQGMQLIDSVRSTLKVESLLTTSEDSYSKVNAQSEIVTKEAADIAGPFTLGVAVTDTYKDYITKVVIYSTGFMLEDDLVDAGTFANTDLLLNALDWVVGEDGTTSLAIPSKSLDDTFITVEANEKVFWGILLIIIIPLGTLVTGFVIWFARRKS